MTAKLAKILSAIIHIHIHSSTFWRVKQHILFVPYVEQMDFIGSDHYLTDQHTELWHHLGATSSAARHTDATTVHIDTPVCIVLCI